MDTKYKGTQLFSQSNSFRISELQKRVPEIPPSTLRPNLFHVWILLIVEKVYNMYQSIYHVDIDLNPKAYTSYKVEFFMGEKE